MNVTEVRIKKIVGEGKLRGYASVTFDNVFVVHNIKIIEGQDNLFVAMPNRRVRTGEFKDIAHPLNTDFRASLQDTIVEAYTNDTGLPLENENGDDNY